MYGGAFTTNLVRQLWTVPRRTSYGRIFDLTVEDMKRDKFAQRPLLVAPIQDVDQAALRIGDVDAVVGDRQGDQITIFIHRSETLEPPAYRIMHD